MNDWIDNQLVSPIRVVELTRIYDGLVATASKGQAFNAKDVNVYCNLWLTCALLEHVNEVLSDIQKENVTETKIKSHLMVEMFDLYADTPLEMLSPESLIVEFETATQVLSWKFEQKINLDMDAIAHEETMLVEMASTPIPEKVSNDLLQCRWHELQARVRQVWGESEFQKVAESSAACS